MMKSQETQISLLICINFHQGSSFRQAGFEINCDYLEDCISDLRLKVDLYLLIGIRLKEVTRDTVIHVDESNEMLMKVDVTNLNSSSYGSNFTSLAGILLKRGVTLSE